MPSSLRPVFDHCSRPHVRRALVRASLTCGLSLALAPGLALDLNLATEAELDNLAGFGPAFTARVMQARAEQPFQSWADFIRRVKGVRQATATRLSRQGARIQQAPYPAPSPQPSRD